jgi:hypothetical protein
MLPVAAAVSAVPVIKGALAGLGSYDPVKDANRQRGNQEAYTLAAAGNRAAFDYLRARSGKFGELMVGAIPALGKTAQMTGGWASEPARVDAYKKFKQLEPQFTALDNGGGTGTLPGQVVDPTNAEKVTLASSVTPIFLGVVVLGLLAVLFRRPSAAGA